jgi:hypothetical protein
LSHRSLSISRCCPELLAEVAASETDEDGLEAGFGDGEVTKAVGIRFANDVGEKALRAVCEDADTFGGRLCAGYSGEVL